MMERNPLERSNANGWNKMNGLSRGFSESRLEVYSSPENRWRTEHQKYEQSKTRGVSLSEATIPSKKVEKGSFLHFFAGGVAGCASTLVTCPIDVIKTRQQSSGEITSSAAKTAQNLHVARNASFTNTIVRNTIRGHYTVATQSIYTCPNSLLQHGRSIMHVEGLRSFYKGLGPSLMGVVPSRALFFYSYDFAKKSLQSDFGFLPNSWNTNVCASTFGGFVCCTATCPLWLVKTKQQLHRRINKTSLNMVDCVRKVWSTEGYKGFYRGLTASYAGIVETVIYFSIYEQLRAIYIRKHQLDPDITTSLTMSSFWELPGLMVISSLSKCVATCFAYPHEVIRTRLREEPVKQKYNGFFQTVKCISAKEGLRGLYGGLPAQLLRQVPNMAILMGVYEGVVYLCA